MPAVLEKESPVSVRFPQVRKKKVSSLSQRMNITQSSFINEAVQNYIELQEWKVEKIKKAMTSLQSGKRIDGDVAMKWFNSLGSTKELSIPTLS
jgi:predicted transcriptional regulator